MKNADAVHSEVNEIIEQFRTINIFVNGLKGHQFVLWCVCPKPQENYQVLL